MKRAIAVILAAAQLLLAPGTGCYRAIAGVVQVPSRIGAAPTGSAGIAGAAIGSFQHAGAGPSLTTSPSLQPSLSRISAVAPDIRPQPVTRSAAPDTIALPQPLTRGTPAVSQEPFERDAPAQTDPALREDVSRPPVPGEESGELRVDGTHPILTEKPEALKEAGAAPVFHAVVRTVGELGKDRLRSGTALNRVFDRARTGLGTFLPGVVGDASALPQRRIRSAVQMTPAWVETDPARQGVPDLESAGEEFQGRKPRKSSTVVPAKAWRTAFYFIGALVLAQLGAEAVGAALPTFIEKSFGAFAAKMAHLTILCYLAEFTARQFAPALIRKFGLRKVFIAAHATKLAIMASLAVMVGMGWMTLPLLELMMVANYFVGGITSTTENSIPPAIVGQENADLEYYWTREKAFRSVISIIGPIATGAAVLSLGFLPVFLTFPVATALTLWIFWKLVQLRRNAGMRVLKGPLTEGDAKKDPWGWLRQIGRGMRIVWRHPGLRYSAVAFSLFMMLSQLLWTLVAPSYGILMAGAGAEELATGIAGWVIGLYNLGALIGVVSLIRRQRAQKRLFEDGLITKAALKERLRRSRHFWLLLSALSLAAMSVFALPLPMLGALLALPSWLSWMGTMSLPALAVMPVGLTHAVAMLKLQSYYQSKVPDKDDMPDAMGFLGAMQVLTQAAGLFAAKYLFTSFVGIAPFAYLAVAVLPVAAIILFVRWRIKKNGFDKP